MKKIFLLSTIFMFGCAANAQYLPEISGYEIIIDRLNDDGQTFPQPNHNIKQDTTVGFSWQRGDGSQLPFITPYNTEPHFLEWVPNTPGLWDADTSETTQFISFIAGVYEITVVEVDQYNNKSGRSDPVYLGIQEVFARIPKGFIMDRLQ